MASNLEANERQKIFIDYYRNYNSHQYTLDLYTQLFQKNQLNDKLKQNYIDKLFLKLQIDVIYNRKNEIKKTQQLLNKLEVAPDIINRKIQEIIPNAPPSPPQSDDGFTNFVQEQISYVNSHRLDNVWSRNLIQTLLDLGLIHSDNLALTCSQISLINGYASYGFYFVRGGMDVLKLLKHTLYTDHEKLKVEIKNEEGKKDKITPNDKLKLQLGLRYSSIINDIVLWGPVNYATFHVLTGQGTLGYYGNVLTVALLFCDFLHALYNIYHLDAKFKFFKEQIRNTPNLTAEEQASIIENAEKIHNQNMLNLKLSAAYSFSLCLAFIVLCNFLIPGAAPAAAMIISSSIILVLQIMINLKDSILKYMNAEEEVIKKIAITEGVSRLLTQALIPGLFIASSYLMALAGGLPAWFFIAAAMAVTTTLVKLVNSITKQIVLGHELADLTQKNSPKEKIDAKQIELDNNKYVIGQDVLKVVGTGAASMLFAGFLLGFNAVILPYLAIPLILGLISISLHWKLEGKKQTVPSLA